MFILYTYICLFFCFNSLSNSSWSAWPYISASLFSLRPFQDDTRFTKSVSGAAEIFPSRLRKVFSPFLFLLLLLLSSFHPTSPLYRHFHAVSADRWQVCCWLEELHTRRHCPAARNSSLQITQLLLIPLFLHLLLLKAACF